MISNSNKSILDKIIKDLIHCTREWEERDGNGVSANYIKFNGRYITSSNMWEERVIQYLIDVYGIRDFDKQLFIYESYKGRFLGYPDEE
jgi:hypothetical protein